jgi:peptide-methionine (S)-S-oxide reductase
MEKKTEIAVFGQGCFWCADAIFSMVKGVLEVLPGYSGGARPNPSYEQVCSGATGHAEVVQILFDPSVVSYEKLVKLFLETHDPTSLNRQGNDVGTQYRSVIFYTSEAQKKTAKALIDKVSAAGFLKRPIVTELKPLEKFYEAEAYHHKYFQNNPDQAYCQFVIEPKIRKLLEEHEDMLK